MQNAVTSFFPLDWSYTGTKMQRLWCRMFWSITWSLMLTTCFTVVDMVQCAMHICKFAQLQNAFRQKRLMILYIKLPRYLLWGKHWQTANYVDWLLLPIAYHYPACAWTPKHPSCNQRKGKWEVQGKALVVGLPKIGVELGKSWREVSGLGHFEARNWRSFIA